MIFYPNISALSCATIPSTGGTGRGVEPKIKSLILDYSQHAVSLFNIIYYYIAPLMLCVPALSNARFASLR